MPPTARAAATPVDPHRRQETEDWLDHHGVEWEYQPDLDIKRIDIEKSLHNQGRVYTKLDPSRVDTYAEAMQRGDKFPAIVVNRVQRKLVAVDANHRIGAYLKLEAPTVPAYVITKGRPATVVRMTFEANVKHGMPTTHEERLHQAVWLIDNGAAQEDAAAMVNIKVQDVRRHWARVKADNRADEVGILRNQWDNISASSKQRLSTISTDEGFAAASNLVFRANLGTEEVVELVQALQPLRSSTRQVSSVKNFADMYGDRIQEAGAGMSTGSKRARTPKQAFNMVLGQMAVLPENPASIAAKFIGDERTEAAKKARTASEQLLAIADLLESASS